jgi:hypothetical protein
MSIEFNRFFIRNKIKHFSNFSDYFYYYIVGRGWDKSIFIQEKLDHLLPIALLAFIVG